MELRETHITPANMVEADIRLRNQEVEIDRLNGAIKKIWRAYQFGTPSDLETALMEATGCEI